MSSKGGFHKKDIIPVEMATVYEFEKAALLVGNPQHVLHFIRSINALKASLSLAYDKSTIDGKLENYIYEETHPASGELVSTAAYSHLFLCLCLIEGERLTRREQLNIAEVGKSQPEKVIMATSKLSEVWATEQTRNTLLNYAGFIARDLQAHSPLYLARQLYHGKSIKMEKGMSALANYLSLIYVSCLFTADYFSCLFFHKKYSYDIIEGVEFYKEETIKAIKKVIEKQNDNYLIKRTDKNSSLIDIEREMKRFLELEEELKNNTMRKTVSELKETIFELTELLEEEQ